MINYKFWTKDEEHKKWLLSQYKKNEELHKNIEVKEFKDTTDKKYENKTIENKELVVIKRENIFKRIINFIKNIGK